jgi:hypothetical protein
VSTSAQVALTGTDGFAGIACLWSTLAAFKLVQAIALSQIACVLGVVVSIRSLSPLTISPLTPHKTINSHALAHENLGENQCLVVLALFVVISDVDSVASDIIWSQVLLPDSVVIHNLVFIVDIVSSQVFVLLVFPITVFCASVQYLLSVLSAISAVVESAQEVTKPLASYVILVFVAQVIAVFLSSLSKQIALYPHLLSKI